MLGILTKSCKFKEKAKPTCPGTHCRIFDKQIHFVQELVVVKYRNHDLGYWETGSQWVSMAEDNSTWIEA